MIGQIEQAIIDTIKEASDSGKLGYELVKVASYAGEYSDNDARFVVKDFPSALVMFDGMRKLKETGGTVTLELRYGVFLGASNLRSERDARRGDGRVVGSYKMTDDILLLLANNDLGIGIGALSFVESKLILVAKASTGLISVYGLSFTTTVTVSTRPTEEEIESEDSVGVFARYNANWDIPPHGDVSTDLPADETADATDHVEMPQ